MFPLLFVYLQTIVLYTAKKLTALIYRFKMTSILYHIGDAFWHMSLKVKKCKHMTISRRDNSPTSNIPDGHGTHMFST